MFTSIHHNNISALVFFQNYNCPISACSLAKEKIDLYLKHVNRHKLTTGDSSKIQFDCPECGASHYTVNDLKGHLTRDHELRPSIKRRKPSFSSCDPCPIQPFLRSLVILLHSIRLPCMKTLSISLTWKKMYLQLKLMVCLFFNL